ncbi:MAG: Flp pilus assembly protein CpaB [Candidatus Limnocylindrales bacterium]
MEMEFKDSSGRRRRLLLILGLVLAVFAGYLAYTMSKNEGQEPLPTKSVVVAAHEIPVRTVIQAGDLALRDVPDDPSVATALTDTASAIGRVTSVPLEAGQIIFGNTLVVSAEGAPFTILSPGEEISDTSPYWRAVSVMVPRDRAVGGAILAGQRVDLYVTVQVDILVLNADGKYENAPSSEGLTSGKSTKIVFQDLEVLEAKPDDDMYVLKVDIHQAEQIYHVAAVAPSSFSLALRPDGDTRIADTTDFGETNDRLIVQFLFPIPQLLDLGQLSGGSVGPQPSITPGPTTSPGSSQVPVEPQVPGSPTPSAAPSP